LLIRAVIIISILLSSVLLNGVSAKAQTFYTLNLDGCTGTCGTPPFGTVEVQAKSSTAVMVTLTLTQPGEQIVEIIDTGAHYAFTFNLSNVTGTPTITNLSSPTFFAVAAPPGPFTQPNFGAFSNAIDCPGCGPGASNPNNPKILSFLVTDPSGLTPANFTSNGSAFFTADILGNNGKTGAVGTKMPNAPATAPDPANMALFGTGLIVIGAFVRKRLGWHHEPLR